MKQTMYASFYTTKRGQKYYDTRTMSHTKRQCRINCADDIKHMIRSVQERIMKDLRVEKVTVTIEPFKTK